MAPQAALLPSFAPATKGRTPCDLRVYVEGDDPYRPEAEAAAYEKVRAFAFERRQAAAHNDTQGVSR